ncbi:hypothetical protein [Lapillicoccus sp.]|uniref:hypothetical protein n=1 Tax=Lapillicoccus sp. TaxID=1909287 RepID=UPI0025E30FC5|nr:hypothetical protein [Lapillicoccus sp.]
MSESDSVEQESKHHVSEPVDLPEQVDVPEQSGDASFDRAVSAVESRWTSHGGEAPEHEPVVVREHGDDPDGDWKPAAVPDGEDADQGGGVSDGSESGQDAGSMS